MISKITVQIEIAKYMISQYIGTNIVNYIIDCYNSLNKNYYV